MYTQNQVEYPLSLVKHYHQQLASYQTQLGQANQQVVSNLQSQNAALKQENDALRNEVAELRRRAETAEQNWSYYYHLYDAESTKVSDLEEQVEDLEKDLGRWERHSNQHSKASGIEMRGKLGPLELGYKRR